MATSPQNFDNDLQDLSVDSVGSEPEELHPNQQHHLESTGLEFIEAGSDCKDRGGVDRGEGPGRGRDGRRGRGRK